MTTMPVQPVTVTLRDGHRVTLREVHEHDRENLQAAIRGLSVESRYTRFFSPLRELSPKMLDQAMQPDAERELQLVAVAREGADEKIVGGARYTALAKATDCEFAVTVVDGWNGRGVARRLLELLMRTARARGFQCMEGYVLTTNFRMLDLAKRLGFTEGPSDEGPTVRTVRRDLASIPS